MSCFTELITPNMESCMKIVDFFLKPQNVLQKQYEALRCFYVDKMLVDDIAKKYGYTTSALYSLIRDFKQIPSDDLSVERKDNNIVVKLKKKRSLPSVLEAMGQYSDTIAWLNDGNINFEGASIS